MRGVSTVTNRKTLKMPIEQVKPGWILGKDVCSNEGSVLLAQDIILTEYGLTKLQDWGIRFVDVLMKDDPIPTPLSKPVHQHTKEDVKFFDIYIKSVNTIGQLFAEMKTAKKVPLQNFQVIAENVLEQVLGVQGVLSRLRQVKSGDEYTFNHSLNVGIYSVLIGKWLNYDEEALRKLAMAGVLHDIGKAKIPPEILSKPGPLTSDEFEVMKQHSLLGYKMIKATPGLDYEIGMAVLQHHEREDGLGYPLSLDALSIGMFAKIIAVADTYDAMTSDRVYRAKCTPYMAADVIMESSFKSLDPSIVQSFLHRITSFFFCDRVRLSNGVIGTIVNVNTLRPTRPLIQTDQGFIDLDKHNNLKIVEVLQ